MIFRGNPGSPFRPIGVIWQPSDNVRRGYETASWYAAIATAGQTTVLWSNGYYTKWTVTGYVTDSFFGPGGRKITPGTVMEYTYHTYDFMFAKSMCDGSLGKDGVIVQLLDEYEADYAPYKHDPSKTGYFLKVSDDGHPLEVTQRPNTGTQVHTYRVKWLGEWQESVLVKRSDGFNGDTTQVAFNIATERLDLLSVMHLL